jgi:hypothetical protein
MKDQKSILNFFGRVSIVADNGNGGQPAAQKNGRSVKKNMNSSK